MRRLVTGLRPLGWIGLFVALSGSEAIQVGARSRDWRLLPLGVILVCVGGIVMLRNRRNDEL